MAADFILYLRTATTSDPGWTWFPDTLVYKTFRDYGPFEIFARSKSKRYFDRVKTILGVADEMTLKEIVSKLEADGGRQLRLWDFETLNPRDLLGLDAIATKP